MKNCGWMTQKEESNLQREILATSNSRWHHPNGRKWPNGRSEEELKIFLIKVKEENEKGGWKLDIEKANIMAFCPIISWQIGGETMETVTDFIFLGVRITMDGDCSHDIKRYLLLGRKPMTNLDNVLKSRDFTFLTKVHIVKTMFFFFFLLVFMHGCNN